MTYLQITLPVKPTKRADAADVYARFKPAFLSSIVGAKAKSLLVRDEDIQVLEIRIYSAG